MLTVLGVSLVYKYKIEEIMANTLKQQIVFKAKGELEAVNHNFNRIISVLNMASSSISKGNYIGSTKTVETLNDITRITGFLDIGITDLNGKVMYGFKLEDEDVAKLKNVFIGKNVIKSYSWSYEYFLDTFYFS